MFAESITIFDRNGDRGRLVTCQLSHKDLEYRQANEPQHENPADVIHAHRQEHAVRLLKEACVRNGDKSQEKAGIRSPLIIA